MANDPHRGCVPRMKTTVLNILAQDAQDVGAQSLRIQSLSNGYDENVKAMFFFIYNLLESLKLTPTLFTQTEFFSPKVCKLVMIPTKYENICGSVTETVDAFSHFSLFRNCATKIFQG